MEVLKVKKAQDVDVTPIGNAHSIRPSQTVWKCPLMPHAHLSEKGGGGGKERLREEMSMFRGVSAI